jgi:hypothetical protein
MHSANLPHIVAAFGTTIGTSAAAQRFSASLVKHFACLLCIAKHLMHRFLKQAIAILKCAAASVAELCALGVGQTSWIMRGAVTFHRPMGRST